MTGIFAAVCIAILVVMALSLARAFYAPTVYDRILGVNMFGTKTVLFIAAVAIDWISPELHPTNNKTKRIIDSFFFIYDILSKLITLCKLYLFD